MRFKKFMAINLVAMLSTAYLFGFGKKEDSKEEVQEPAFKQTVYKVLDFVPQSVSQICRKLEAQGNDSAIPEIIHVLMELFAEGKCVQDGGYFSLKIGG